MLLILKGHDHALGSATKRDNVTKSLGHALTTMCVAQMWQATQGCLRGASGMLLGIRFAVRGSWFVVRFRGEEGAADS